MKVVKLILQCLGGLMALILLSTFWDYFSTQPPPKKLIYRKRVIAATPEFLFPYVNNLKQWERWSYFHKNIPKAGFDYEGKSNLGDSSSCYWRCKDLSYCYLYIGKVEPNKLINFNFEFSYIKNNHCEIGFTPVAGGTEVFMAMQTHDTAKVEGEITNTIKLMNGVEHDFGYDFDRCLQGLDSVAAYDKKNGL